MHILVDDGHGAMGTGKTSLLLSIIVWWLDPREQMTISISRCKNKFTMLQDLYVSLGKDDIFSQKPPMRLHSHILRNLKFVIFKDILLDCKRLDHICEHFPAGRQKKRLQPSIVPTTLEEILGPLSSSKALTR